MDGKCKEWWCKNKNDGVSQRSIFVYSNLISL